LNTDIQIIHQNLEEDNDDNNFNHDSNQMVFNQ